MSISVIILTQQGTTSLWTFTAFSRVIILTDYITQPLDELPNDDTVCSVAYSFTLHCAPLHRQILWEYHQI